MNLGGWKHYRFMSKSGPTLYTKNSSEMIRTDYRVSNNPDQRRKDNPLEMRDVRASSSRRGYRLFAPVQDIIFGFSLQHGRRLAIAALD